MITKLGSVCVMSPIQVLWKRRVGYAWLTMPSISVAGMVSIRRRRLLVLVALITLTAALVAQPSATGVVASASVAVIVLALVVLCVALPSLVHGHDAPRRDRRS